VEEKIILQNVRLKVTPARLAVLELLRKSREPLDVTTIIEHFHRQKIKVDPATVFRIMNLFTEKEITKPIQFHEGKFRYELASKEDHHHLICESCGEIDDVSDMVIPAMEKRIKKKNNFLVKRHTLEFFGLCQNCQK